MNSPIEHQQRVLEKLEAARHSYEAGSGGLSACEIAKRGQESVGLKELEGRMIALQDLARRMRKSAADESVADIVAELLSQWQSLPEGSETWCAYKRAGIQALQE